MLGAGSQHGIFQHGQHQPRKAAAMELGAINRFGDECGGKQAARRADMRHAQRFHRRRQTFAVFGIGCERKVDAREGDGVFFGEKNGRFFHLPRRFFNARD